MTPLTGDELRAARTQAQHLDGRLPATKLVEAVRDVVGIQGQLAAAMQLALRARVSDLELRDVEQAIAEQHSLARTWAMRGTLHLLAAEDVGWIVGLLGAGFSAKDKRRRLQLGVDEKVSAAGLKAIREILKASDPLTRHELREKLLERAVKIDPKGQALIHLIAQAALEGIICLGPDRANGETTYVLLDVWIKSSKPVTKDKALAELAERYLMGYGPADVKDFAAWSGLSLTEAKLGWTALEKAERLIDVQVGERTLSTLVKAKPMAGAQPMVRLLPAFDAYLLGYRQREDLVRKEHQPEVYHGGQTVPVVLVDGLAAGVWRYERTPKRLKITVKAFEAFDREVERLIVEEADDIGRFWRTPVTLNG
ncbi:MAG: winged helix DNA-binding domain-containing protein [Chloroflexi bacterium]|nr:winged helix DNA-binding domain-containing protein [Chloroflexota bacterium]